MPGIWLVGERVIPMAFVRDREEIEEIHGMELEVMNFWDLSRLYVSTPQSYILIVVPIA